MNQELIIKRLSLIKYLYKQGVEISKQPETIAFHSVLLFHDAIEMFLKLAANERNIKSDKFSFIEYWNNIPELTLKASMETFNKLRVNLKHHGLLPSKIDLETSRVNTTDFFTQNTSLIFNIKFDSVNLFNLIIYPNTQKYLYKAQEYLDVGKFEDCVEESTMAFYELLHDYRESKSNFNTTNKFTFIEHVRFDTKEQLRGISGPINDMADKFNKNFESINEALEIISLGIDYKKYTKFKHLIPIVHRMIDKSYHMQIWGDKIWDKENCQFLIDFVLESAIKVQEFDYDINSINPEKEFVLHIVKKTE